MDNEQLCRVYEQYWQHARHAEDNTWLFTNNYSIIMAAAIAIIGANLSEEMKVGIALFGAILSILGFGVVYTNRVPFMKFALTAELIALNEFHIKDEYRRFFPRDGKVFPKDKWFDLHDILSGFYSLLAGIMTYFCTKLCLKNLTVAIIAATIIVLLLLLVHFVVIRPKKYIKEISEELAEKIEIHSAQEETMSLSNR